MLPVTATKLRDPRGIVDEDGIYYAPAYFYKFDKKGMYAKKNLPMFAILIFESPIFADEEKEKFKRKVLYPYLTSEFYRKFASRQYVFFFNFKFFALTTLDRALSVGVTGDDRYVVPITTKYGQERKELKIYADKTEDFYARGRVNAYNESNFLLDISITSDKTSQPIAELTSSYIVDTGASDTYLPILEKWDFTSSQYIIDENNSFLNKELEKINNSKRFREPYPVSISGDDIIMKMRIYFNPAVYLNIGNGLGAYMNCLTTPINGPSIYRGKKINKLPCSNLAGRTLIFQFNISINPTYYNTIMTFTPLDAQLMNTKYSTNGSLERLSVNSSEKDDSTESIHSKSSEDSKLILLKKIYNDEINNNICLKQNSIFYVDLSSGLSNWVNLFLLEDMNPISYNTFVLNKCITLKIIAKVDNDPILEEEFVVDVNIDGYIIYDTALEKYTFIYISDFDQIGTFYEPRLNLPVPLQENFTNYIQ